MISRDHHRTLRDADALPILLRAYSEPADNPEPAAGSGWKSRLPVVASAWTLVFDTETSTDPSQRFRLGFYQLRQGDRLDEEGVFIDADALTAAEVASIERYCLSAGLPAPTTLAQFRETVFLEKAYACGATVVGFNLPFDLARIAARASPARVTRFRSKMRGGFTLAMSDRTGWPHVQVKHLSPGVALIEFSSPGKAPTARSKRKREDFTPTHRGAFVDVKTIAAALTSGSHSLASLTETLKTSTRKIASDEHGEVSDTYLAYARSDVQATWECYRELKNLYASYGLDTPLHSVMSEAGLGKAMLAQLGVRPWTKCQPDYPAKGKSLILSSYFGGRTEVRIRRRSVRVLHTDFTSMYPTVCTLMGLWRFITAEGFVERDATAEVRKFAADARPEDFIQQAPWRSLTTLVRVRPDRTLLPVRACYAGELHATIGLNILSADRDVWVTLADYLAGKFLSGAAPEILEAIEFSPGPPQSGLKPQRILGKFDFDPSSEDLFRALISRRQAIKAAMPGMTPEERIEAEKERQNLKILANATSYGIFMQINVAKLDLKKRVNVFRPDGSVFQVLTNQIEEPGPYFNPLISTLITGAARLLLGLAEWKSLDCGLEWAFCDTDSLAIAKPDAMDEGEFLERATSVSSWFLPLNPYGTGEPLLNVEDYNIRNGEISPLFCYAISSKRYALFNVSDDGRPLIRKASAHGLGHLLPPYDDGTAIASIPLRQTGLCRGKDFVPQWQHDLWFKIIEAAIAGTPQSIRFDWHPSLVGPCASRYGATSPDLLRWMDAYNVDRDYASAVKPFGFMLAFHAKADIPVDDVAALNGGPSRRKIAPLAPYEREVSKAIPHVFDRITQRPVDANELQSYAESVALYPFRPESKFGNAEAFHIGKTARRHVYATEFQWIGKEADHWEDAALNAPGREIVIRYDDPNSAVARSSRLVRKAAPILGDAGVSRAIKVPRSMVAELTSRKTLTLKRALSAEAEARLRSAVRSAHFKEQKAQRRKVLLAKQVQECGGLRAMARQYGLDPSNLSKLLRSRGD